MGCRALAISDTQIEGALVADLETISRLISRYRNFEKMHGARPSLVKSQIDESLARLYADVLKYLRNRGEIFRCKTNW
jgi:hypothetical protein